MNISRQLGNAIEDMFFPNTTRLAQYESFPIVKMFETNININGVFFVPLFIRNVADYVSYEDEITTIVSPLHISIKKSAGSSNKILSEIGRVGDTYKLAEISLKDKIYYAGSGLLFDDEFNLMLIAGRECFLKDNLVVEGKRICYIDPSIFDSDNSLAKLIRTKVIYYLSDRTKMDDPVRVIIEDVKNKFIIKNGGFPLTSNSWLWNIIEKNKDQMYN